MAGFHGDARRAVGAGRAARRSSTWAAARACSPSSGPSGSATGASSASTSTTRSCAPSGPSASAPNLEFRAEEATRLSFADDEFDLAAAIEVLEHVPEPGGDAWPRWRAWRARHLLVSVPREPLWRGLNMARGAYWRDLGNTPGHVNHWSKRSFVSLLSRHGDGGGGPLALPLDHAARPASAAWPSPRSAATAAAPRSCRWGSAPPGWSPSATSRSPQPLADRGRVRRASRCCGRRCSSPSRCSTGRWSSCCRARSPTATRAASTGNEHLRVAATIQLALGRGVRGRRAGAARADPGRPVRRLVHALLGAGRGRARLRGELLRARLPGRPPPLRRSTAGWC